MIFRNFPPFARILGALTRRSSIPPPAKPLAPPADLPAKPCQSGSPYLLLKDRSAPIFGSLLATIPTASYTYETATSPETPGTAFAFFPVSRSIRQSILAVRTSIANQTGNRWPIDGRQPHAEITRSCSWLPAKKSSASISAPPTPSSQ